MKFSVQPKHRNICRRLLETGTLPKSACGQSLIRSFKPLLDSGVLRWEKSAGGQRLTTINRAAFERWLGQHFPNSQSDSNTESSRIQAVARFRNSKALRSNLPIVVTLRSTRDGVLLCDGKPLETTQATREHGVFSFTLTDPSPYALQGVCALIENLAVFQSFERLGLEAPLAIWSSGGTNSNRFLSWLSLSVQRGLRILDLPDYDPAGLTAFLRHYGKLGDAVALYLPDNLAALFHSHSNDSLLRKFRNQQMLMKLRNAEHPDVRRVVALIEETNRALEHEATLIKREQKS